MRLNCDLGENFGAWHMSVDNAIMQFIDQANIACGFHAGDPTTILDTIRAAKANLLSIGAHPSYPDLVGFGRRHIAMTETDLIATLCYQIAALRGLCDINGTTLDYVKPHGALYNDCIKDSGIRRSVMRAVSQFDGVELMIQSVPQHAQYSLEAKEFGLGLQFEAFVDRRYTDDGTLQARQIQGAVLNFDEAFTQAQNIISTGTIETSTGKTLSINASTLCLHGDNPDSLELAKSIQGLLAASD